MGDILWRRRSQRPSQCLPLWQQHGPENHDIISETGHLGYTEAASTTAFTQSYRAFQQAALQQDPSYRVRGILTDGFDSTTSSLRTLFPGARLGNCLRHAINKLPAKLVAIASPVRKALRSQFHTLLYRARQ